MSYSKLQHEDVGGEIRKAMKMFKRFEIVKGYSDNHYAKQKTSSKKVQMFNKSFAGRRLQNEWKRLEKELPESICVRAYEGRPELLRAAIVGAAGTPYHDNAFFFDLCFTEEYPLKRPKIHYHSFGHRINPAFHKNGEVNLGQWGLWTVASLLLSIQALVLTEKTYFNVLANGQWAGRKDWENRASAYNEEIFLNSCKTILCFLAKPPKHYEEFVSWHFRRHGETILLACRAYMDGYAKVGGQTTEYGPSADIITSKNFKSSMKILYPKLSAAFMKNECSLKKYFAKEAPLHCCTGFKLQVRKENRKLDEAFSANCFEGN